MSLARPFPARAPVWALALLVLLPVALPAQSPSQLRDVRAVRAAYVYNLTKLIDWSPETTELIVGYRGNADSGLVLRSMLEGKLSGPRVIRVIFPAADQLQKCNILYFGEESENPRATLASLGNAKIVTVGETHSFPQEGGMVGLVKVGDHIQLELNQQAAQSAHVTFDPSLLTSAVVLEPAGKHSNAPAERKLSRRQDPQYPKIAAEMSLHGTVKLMVWIAPDGSVHRVECLGGHPLLAAAALEAVQTWKYEPAPTESSQIIELKF